MRNLLSKKMVILSVAIFMLAQNSYGVKIRDNILIFDGVISDLESVEYHVTAGQPWGGVIPVGTGIAIDIKAGRSGNASNHEFLENAGYTQSYSYADKTNFAVIATFNFMYKDGRTYSCQHVAIEEAGINLKYRDPVGSNYLHPMRNVWFVHSNKPNDSSIVSILKADSARLDCQDEEVTNNHYEFIITPKVVYTQEDYDDSSDPDNEFNITKVE